MIDWKNETSRAGRIAATCKWHNEARQAPPIGPDREWAKRWLVDLENKGAITAEEADEIRELCNWTRQMRLL